MTYTVADLTSSILDDSDLCEINLSCTGFLKTLLIDYCFKAFNLEEANIRLASLSWLWFVMRPYPEFDLSPIGSYS